MLVNRVQRFCVQDGPGLRTTVFTQGCSLRCWWCHNPDTIPLRHENGRRVSIDSLVEFVLRDEAFWRKGKGGLTVSGGECLLQAGAVRALFEGVKAVRPDIHCTVDTAGNVPLDNVQTVDPLTDLYLWDWKAVSPSLYRQGTGGNVENTLRNLRWVLEKTDTPVTLRIPLIHGFNETEAELTAMALGIAELPREVSVEILPGHTVGCDLSEKDPDPTVPAERANRALDLFSNHNLNTLIRW